MHKAFHIGDRLGVNLAWEVFNVTNTTRFDAHNIGDSYGSANLGVYGGAYGTARHMQLSGRIEF